MKRRRRRPSAPKTKVVGKTIAEGSVKKASMVSSVAKRMGMMSPFSAA